MSAGVEERGHPFTFGRRMPYRAKNIPALTIDRLGVSICGLRSTYDGEAQFIAHCDMGRDVAPSS